MKRLNLHSCLHSRCLDAASNCIILLQSLYLGR